jgi:uncharacterized protein
MTEAADGTDVTVRDRVVSGPWGEQQGLDGRARVLWVVTGVTVSLLVFGTAAVGLAVAGWVWWWPLAAAPVASTMVAVYAHLHWRHWWWGTSTEALEIGYGVVFRRASYVPYHRIQQIDVHRDLLERFVGLARLTVHTASATTDASIPGLAVGDARALRQHLLARAGRDDGV